MSLRSFRENLEARIGRNDAIRPFVCDGSPYSCEAFLVGINPASSVAFWPFWNDKTGFCKKAWYERYLIERAAAPLTLGRTRSQLVSSTRRRIEWIVDAASPVKILETNLFSVPTPKAADLRIEDKQTSAFEYLLSEVSPSVLLLHGKAVREYVEDHCGHSLTSCFSSTTINGKVVKVAAVPQLFNASKGRAKQLGEAIRSLCPSGYLPP